ncbi:S-adenosyl-L-methionine-dependent methyltransferases superfamily protein [Quillaja saponaria]|uniref:Methyltransferase n=1 Tax=Quillaja saponaria TaxID=32244 RepID=A0AAD7LKJ8_QUISA|nr:S-adenosyl-L-methionine-dependent methyltransferases superfamily protein [Quillaja saponaria]KAJ7958996.1 S-adenosyl-L-methionine-dependent methyltransferases superfamily protein [Quillaja saponaria]
MSRPLHRGLSGVRISGNSNDLWDSQLKDRTEKEDLDRRGSADQSHLAMGFPLRLFSSDNSHSKCGGTENGFTSDPFIVGTLRSRQKLMMQFLKFSLVLIIFLAVSGSFWWTISISTSSRGHIYHGYRRLQEKLVSDLLDIGELSHGSLRLKEFEFCSQEFENYVPCFNVSENLAVGYSDGNEFDRECKHELKQNCLVLPPMNYKIPLRWPTGRDVIWVGNVKITAQEVLSSGSFTKRMMMLDEEQISFRSASLMFDGVEDYSHQIAEMIGLRNESNFIQAGVRTILDIGCGYGSFGAHLFSSQLLTMCIANYEPSGSQVQLTLERGLPAMIGSFTSRRLPYPSLSFDMLHCARCGIDWDQKDGILLIEADRLLKPGGYFVWTSPLTSAQSFPRNKENQKRWNFVRDFVENLCWEMLSQQEETVVWKKTSRRNCYTARKPGAGPSLCNKGHDVETPYYRQLENCIGGTQSNRWISIEKRTWPSRANLNKTELAIYGLQPEEFTEDSENWRTAVRNYWSLMSPLIFSDHPKRPGDEDPSPPYNMLRNVLDMNAHFGGFSSALLEAGKSVWVMNVVPTSGTNYLPMILDRGFVGVLHDWCDAFPTYPRTYDLVHAGGLLSLEAGQQRRCTTLDLFTEIDRLLRPEGWVIIRDTAALVESARALTAQLKWDARVIEIESDSDEKLLICQKPFFKRQAG